MGENISSLGGPRLESFIKEWNVMWVETNCRNFHLFCAGEKLTATCFGRAFGIFGSANLDQGRHILHPANSVVNLLGI